MRLNFRQGGLKKILSSGLIRYRGPSHKNQVALTFDDGPVPGITDEIVRALADRGHRATFFVIGRKAEQRPQLVRTIISNGFEIGNHTYSHKLLSSSGYIEIADEVNRTDDILKKTVPGPTWFRPPGGQLSWKLLAYLWRRGRRRSPVLWSICIPQENRKSKEEIVQLLNAAEPSAGDIILLHDDHPVILEALPSILELIEGRGLRSVSLSELL